ncbi:alpha/beta-hydrolase [Annulohypoxylon truncatum]|uniref:alpha/beta-hydrolase n=1 Tax=Annulohypoxylon truncatum TaxID=327061 RepID=UPI00200732B3|nr:alpha/beta-hydrolase [Annulohypoxylon truncatum]KAI1207601.1 alpha/beta-hydrolase [Annulohypoxylon truncatum]
MLTISTATTNSTWRSREDNTLPIGGRTMSTSSWTTMSMAENADTESIFFSSLNPLAPISIVMIHVLLSSHLEWAHCWPQLSEYHLLIPDLPQHSRSKHVGPFSFVLAADHIARMIREHAHDGRAHVVGLSTGGFVAMELIRRHPDVVLSAFVSNAVPLTEAWKNLSSSPRISYLGLSVLLHSPKSLLFKATGWAPEFQNDQLLKEIKRNNTSRLYEAGARETYNWSRDDMVEVGKKDIRIALVVGGKQDNVEGTREMGQLLTSLGSKAGKESRAFVVKDAIHGWNLQYPVVFARGIRAWIEKHPLPQGFEPLEPPKPPGPPV